MLNPFCGTYNRCCSLGRYGQLIFGFSLLFYLPVCQAQKLKTLEEVAVLGSRIEQALDENSSSLSVLNQQELRQVRAVHIQQSLSRIPGVSLQRGNGQESLPGIRSAVLTGPGACGSVLIMEQAIAVRGAGVCNLNELFDTHYEAAERIEVLRGASSAFYGSNALTGSVNVVLPHQGRDYLSLEVGANNFTRGQAAISYPGGRIYATVSEDGGYRESAGYTQTKLSWRHAVDIADWQFKSGATYVNLDQQTAGFITGLNSFKDKALSRQNPDPNAFRDSESLRVWVQAKRDFSDAYTVDGAVYLRNTDMDFLLHFLPGDPLEKNAQTGFGWQSAVRFQIDERLNLALGLDADFTDSQLSQVQAQATLGSNFLVETIPSGVQYDYQVDAQQIGIFAQVEWLISEKWRVLAGLRLERLEYQYDNLSLNGRTRDNGSECGFGGCRYSRPADRKDSFTHASPKLELHYQASDKWRLSWSVADSFRAPQAAELYRLQRAQRVADLDVVAALSVELAARYQSQNTDLSVVLYRLASDNLIIRDSGFFNIDGQSTLSQGLEISATHYLNKGWSLKAVGSFAQHKYSSELVLGGVNINGNRVDTAPGIFGSVFLGWRAQNRISAELEAQYLSRYFLNAENTRQYPGHHLMNARANYALNDNWSFALRVLNITDRRYANRADFTSFTNERYFPGEPRSVFAEARYNF